MPPPVEIGLTNLSKMGGGTDAPSPPGCDNPALYSSMSEFNLYDKAIKNNIHSTIICHSTISSPYLLEYFGDGLDALEIISFSSGFLIISGYFILFCARNMSYVILGCFCSDSSFDSKWM